MFLFTLHATGIGYILMHAYISFFFTVTATGIYGYNIRKKKERRNQSDLRTTEPLHFVIYFFLNSTRVTTQHFFSLLLNRTDTHTQTGRSRAMYRKKKKHFSAPCWHQTTIDRLNPVCRYHRQEQSMTSHIYGPSKQSNRTSSPPVHLDGKTLR